MFAERGTARDRVARRATWLLVANDGRVGQTGPMHIKADGFSADEIEGFRSAQRRSFAILQEVARGLEESWSERAAVKLLFGAFADHGIDRFFHVPVALFGERTALPEPWGLMSFGPTGERLRAGIPVIFDASPLIGEFLVDTSYAWSFGENPVHLALKARNIGFRGSILDEVSRGRSFKEIATGVDDELRSEGLTNCHRLHPEAVLGHRALKIEDDTSATPVDGFHPAILDWFRSEIAACAADPMRSPTWNDTTASDHPPFPGLWAVEPHIARDGVGVKWEELLLVEDDGTAAWLDDDVPHLI